MKHWEIIKGWEGEGKVRVGVEEGGYEWSNGRRESERNK